MVTIIMLHVVANSNTAEDLGSLLPDIQFSGFLSNAVPSPRQYNFTRNFDINPDWSDVCFEDNATVSCDPSGCGCIM